MLLAYPGTFTALLAVALGAAAAAVRADVIDVSFDEPMLDRWFYPFNSNPGFKTEASIFGAVIDPEDGFVPEFDNRDGQMLIGFDTSAVVPPGLGADGYAVLSATVYVTVKSDLTFQYDPTPDPYTSWLPSNHPDFEPDPDPGRPLELFGAGFRCGHTASTFAENGPFCDGCNCFPPNPCRSVRCVFPIDFDAGCGAGDVSNNVDDGFDPVPFAVAETALLQGDAVPGDTELTFVIDVDDPCIHGYLGQALDEGMLDVVIASIFIAFQQQEGTYPKLYCKEDLDVQLGFVSAARLAMTVQTGVPGDVDGDGTVGIDDFLMLLAAWGACPEPCPPSCPADFDGDCEVGVNDFLILLANWTL